MIATFVKHYLDPENQTIYKLDPPYEGHSLVLLSSFNIGPYSLSVKRGIETDVFAMVDGKPDFDRDFIHRHYGSSHKETLKEMGYELR